MDLIQDFQEIAQLSHDNARNKGFWDAELKHGQRRNDGEMLSLIHSEVTELYDALISKRPSQKLIGFSEIEEECVDIIIRLADMIYRRGWAVADYFTLESPELSHMQQALQQLDSNYIRANIIWSTFSINVWDKPQKPYVSNLLIMKQFVRRSQT